MCFLHSQIYCIHSLHFFIPFLIFTLNLKFTLIFIQSPMSFFHSVQHFSRPNGWSPTGSLQSPQVICPHIIHYPMHQWPCQGLVTFSLIPYHMHTWPCQDFWAKLARLYQGQELLQLGPLMEEKINKKILTRIKVWRQQVYPKPFAIIRK